MRNIGLAFILILIGMLIWKAWEKEPPNQSTRLASAATDLKPEPELDVPSGRSIRLNSPAHTAEKYSLQNHQLIQSPQVQSGDVNPTVKRSPTSIEQEKDVEQRPSTKERVFERLIIPSIKVNAKVVSKSYSDLTWDLSNLGHDVAVLEDVPTQTTNNNLVFAGHVTVRNGSHGPFRYLFRLNPGDTLLLEDEDYIYTYAVRDQVLVYPEDSSVLKDTSHPQMILITCTTYDEETSTYLRRRVIFADLKKVELKDVLVD